ncbi:hypothetical protein OAO71_00955 [Planctomycetota bacterium]|jgi:hypothetical protein|nr:hypothetical protein [Planctomycetota bacterium]MDC0585237.1 hypothetical protein [Planctomycetota bacterium]
MKLPLILSCAALTVSGLCLLSTVNSSPEGPAAGPPVQDDRGLAEVREELAAFRGELRDLAGRLEVLANRPAAPARIPAGALVEQSDLDALRADLLAELTESGSSPGGKAAAAEGLKNDVAAALEEVRAAERAAKAEAKGAAAMAKLDAQMPEYQQQLGLTNAQTEGLRGVIEARNERVAEMMRLWESGDRAAAGELKSNEAETYQAELQGVLNQQQVEQFNAMGGGRRGGK